MIFTSNKSSKRISVVFEIGLITSVLLSKADKLTKFDVDKHVFIQCQDIYDIHSKYDE